MTIKADLLWRKEEMQYWIMALIGIIFVIWMFRYDKNHPNQIKKVMVRCKNHCISVGGLG